VIWLLLFGCCDLVVVIWLLLFGCCHLVVVIWLLLFGCCDLVVVIWLLLFGSFIAFFVLALYKVKYDIRLSRLSLLRPVRYLETTTYFVPKKLYSILLGFVIKTNSLLRPTFVVHEGGLISETLLHFLLSVIYSLQVLLCCQNTKPTNYTRSDLKIFANSVFLCLFILFIFTVNVVYLSF